MLATYRCSACRGEWPITVHDYPRQTVVWRTGACRGLCPLCWRVVRPRVKEMCWFCGNGIRQCRCYDGE